MATIIRTDGEREDFALVVHSQLETAVGGRVTLVDVARQVASDQLLAVNSNAAGTNQIRNEAASELAGRDIFGDVVLLLVDELGNLSDEERGDAQ